MMRHVSRAVRASSSEGGAIGPTLPTTDLVARLTAKAGVTTGATFGWADQVGSADATQSVALDQPTYPASSVVDFDGSNHWLDWTGLATSGAAWTIMFAINADTVSGTQKLFQSSLAGDVVFFFQTGGNTRLTVGGATVGSVAAKTGTQIVTGQGDGAGTAYFWVDGVDASGGGTAVTDTAVGSDVGLCGRHASGTSPFNGGVYEALVYDAAIDATQRSAARDWLAAEHSL